MLSYAYSTFKNSIFYSQVIQRYRELNFYILCEPFDFHYGLNNMLSTQMGR